jgi:ABC-type methionine transport system ATPase subunit
MLTGMVKPTKGYAVVAGKDIRTQMNQIRQDVGICLQHDCLFPMLTVKEHIEFFARVKGMYAKMSKSDAEAKIMTSIEDVALLEKRNTLSKNLSGGMKRKLSVAVAFCGDSSTVLLDEPTYVKAIHDCCPTTNWFLTCLLSSASKERYGSVQQAVHMERDSPIQRESLHHPYHSFYGRSRHPWR